MDVKKIRGFGTWLFAGPRGQQVQFSGWAGDAASYLSEQYGPGRWTVAA